MLIIFRLCNGKLRTIYARVFVIKITKCTLMKLARLPRDSLKAKFMKFAYWHNYSTELIVIILGLEILISLKIQLFILIQYA